MKIPLLICLTVTYAPLAFAAESPFLAVPGKVIYESKLDTVPSWKGGKGTWEVVDGALRGAEKASDKHGAVTLNQTKLGDFVLEYEFKFEGAKSTSLSVNGAKGHMARISITPQSVMIQKDDSDHEGPDKGIVFARFSADLKPGTWHTVRMEMVGDTMLGKVDDLMAWGSHEMFKQERTSSGFTVGGEFVHFRNLKVSEAALNPGWEKVQATLPKPGEKMEAGGGKAPAKKKAE